MVMPERDIGTTAPMEIEVVWNIRCPTSRQRMDVDELAGK
jgi:hypothetical protein